MEELSFLKVILLAEDDADDRELFCEALSDNLKRINIHCTENGQEALDKLEHFTVMPDMIFLDINMPVMNGWQCLKKLKETEAYKHIPVIMFSTSSHQRDANIALDLGALCFFTKPGDFNQLKNILEVIASNTPENILEAVSKYESIKAHKIFACS